METKAMLFVALGRVLRDLQGSRHALIQTPDLKYTIAFAEKALKLAAKDFHKKG